MEKGAEVEVEIEVWEEGESVEGRFVKMGRGVKKVR